MNILEVEKVVGELNDKMRDQTDYDHTYLELCSNSYCIIIEFLGMQIWTSDWDSREYVDEDNDIYESLDTYLRREINNEIEKLNRIAL